MLKRETWNIIQLGAGLCLLYTAISSQAFVVETVMAHRHEEDPRFSSHAGYYSTAIAAASFLISNIVAPPVIKFLTPKWSLVVSAAGFSVYMAGFLFLNPFFLYFSSVLMGLCGGVMWTASGCYLAQNSNKHTIGRNSGIMWIIFMCSMVIGGFFLLIMFARGETNVISLTLTRYLYGGFLAFSVAAIICFAFLPQKNEEEEKGKETTDGGYWNELMKSFYLLKTKDILLLFPLFAYTGMEPCFYSLVYTTALTFTSAFTVNTNVLIAWCSVLTGFGQIAAALPVIILGKRAHRFGFSPIVLFGCVSGLIASALVLINIPSNATYERTNETSLITPSIPIALVAGFLFGASECLVNTAIYAFLSMRYPDESTQAFAILKFINALPTLACIYFGTLMELHWQLLILTGCAVLTFVGFTSAEKRFETMKEEKK